MSETLARRLAVLSGLALAAAVALWWLGSTRIAIDRGADAGRSSAQALQAAWLARGMALAIVGVRVGALRGWRPGAAAALGLIAPAWPLLVLAWSASTAPLAQVVLAECVLLASGGVLPLIGLGLRRALPSAPSADLAAAGVGVALAAAWWLASGHWAWTPF